MQALSAGSEEASDLQPLCQTRYPRYVEERQKDGKQHGVGPAKPWRRSPSKKNPMAVVVHVVVPVVRVGPRGTQGPHSPQGVTGPCGHARSTGTVSRPVPGTRPARPDRRRINVLSPAGQRFCQQIYASLVAIVTGLLRTLFSCEGHSFALASHAYRSGLAAAFAGWLRLFSQAL